jgi:hypothetical protein
MFSILLLNIRFICFEATLLIILTDTPLYYWRQTMSCQLASPRMLAYENITKSRTARLSTRVFARGYDACSNRKIIPDLFCARRVEIVCCDD